MADAKAAKKRKNLRQRSRGVAGLVPAVVALHLAAPAAGQLKPERLDLDAKAQLHGWNEDQARKATEMRDRYQEGQARFYEFAGIGFGLHMSRLQPCNGPIYFVLGEAGDLRMMMDGAEGSLAVQPTGHALVEKTMDEVRQALKANHPNSRLWYADVYEHLVEACGG